MPNTLLQGLYYFKRGATLVLEPSLRRFVLLPLLLNALLFTALMLLAGHYYGLFTHWVNSLIPSFFAYIAWLFWLLFVLGFVFIAGVSFTAIATLIAAPFNALLSEKVEGHLSGTPPKNANATLSETLKDIPRVVNRQLQIMAYFLPRALALLLLFFIPVVNLIASPLWFVFSAWVLALQFNDYAMDNNYIPFPKMRQLLSQQRFTTLGFGLVALALTLVPVVNFFVMPIAVAGATAFYCDAIKESR
jgi:CysZ protein